MEKSRIDAAQFLLENEKVLLKAHAKKGKGIYIETAFCALFWLLTVAGDCFIVGYANQVKTLTNQTSWFLPFFIALVVLHLVPLGMWVVSLSSKATANSESWYILTDKRIISLSGGKPMRVEFIELKDVTSVKTAKKYLSAGLEGGRYFKISKIDEIAEFASLLETQLDRIFDGGYGENAQNEEEKPLTDNASADNESLNNAGEPQNINETQTSEKID